MEAVRLNKFLSEAGYCSRRKADELIDDGRVTVNGKAAVPGLKVTTEDEILVDGKKISSEKAKPVLLAVNKPRGIVCTTTGIDKDNIVDFLNYPERIYPVGRLDKDSEGLILMTNQGELMNRILKGSNGHEKEYIVRVRQPITESFIHAMREGVPIPDMNREYRKNPGVEADEVPTVMTKKCKVDKINDYTFRIVLTQGLNRQIRRMCEFLGYRVDTLKRVRVININLGNLESGKYRLIEGEEYETLLRTIKLSEAGFHAGSKGHVNSKAQTGGRGKGTANARTGFRENKPENSQAGARGNKTANSQTGGRGNKPVNSQTESKGNNPAENKEKPKGKRIAINPAYLNRGKHE